MHSLLQNVVPGSQARSIQYSMKQFVHNTQYRSISAYYLSGTASESVLNQAVVPIVAQSVCKKPDWYGDRVFDVQFCAGYEQGIVDSCTVRRLPKEHHRLPTITYMLSLNLKRNKSNGFGAMHLKYFIKTNHVQLKSRKSRHWFTQNTS